jgi:NAD-dependent DNA ligase
LYCFTGTFVSGKRNWCADQTANRGGLVTDSISRDLYALVIGSKVSQAWANQSYGRKIEKAVLLKEEQEKMGIEPVKILCEDHWLKFLS